MAKTKNKRNAGLADKVHNKKRHDNMKKKLNPFEVHINREKIKVLGKKSKHDRGLPGVSRAKAIKKRKETIGTEMKLMNKTNTFIDRRIGERDSQLSAEEQMVVRFAAERARQHNRKNIYNLADDEILTHRGQTLEQIEKFDDPRSDEEDDEESKKYGGLDDEFVSEGHFGGGILAKTDTKDGSKSHKDLIEQLIAESKKRKAEKQKEKEQTLDLTEKLDSEWKDLQPVVFKKARVEKESIIDKLLSQAEEKSQDYDKMMRELKFDRRGTPSDALKTDEKQAKEEREKLEQWERERQQRMLGDHETETIRVQKTTVKHRSADDLEDNFELEDEKEFMLAYDKDGKPLVPENILKDYSVPNAKPKFDDGISDTSSEEDDDSGDEEDSNDGDDDNDDDENVNIEKVTNGNGNSSEDSSDEDDEEQENRKVKKVVKDAINQNGESGSSGDSSDDEDDKVQDKNKVKKLVEDAKIGNGEASSSEDSSNDEDDITQDNNKVKKGVDEAKTKKKITELTKHKENDDCKTKNQKKDIINKEINVDDEVTDDDDGSDDNDTENDDSDDESDGGDAKNAVDDFNDLKSSGSEDEMETGEDVEKIGSFFELKLAEGDNLKELLTGKTPIQQSTALQKLIKSYDPSLSENNKEKLSRLFAHMLQYINDIFTNLHEESDVIKAFLVFDKLVPYFFDLAKMNKVSAKKFLVELIKEKHDVFEKRPKVVPDLNTLIFFKLVQLLYPTSDFRHPVTTPCLIFLAEILTKCRFCDAYSVSRGLFVTSLILEYTMLSKRLVPSVINFLRGILYLSASTSILNPIQVVPPFRLHKDEKILNLDHDCSKLTVESKMAAKDLVAKEISDDFKIRTLFVSVLLLKEFFNFFNEIEAQQCLFEPHIQLLGRIDTDLYPENVRKTVRKVMKHMKETLELKTFTQLTREKKRPKALRLYEPDIQEVFTGSKSSKLSREAADRARLQTKYKKAMKGALREIRRDKAYIASVKIKQKIASDNVRKEKVRQIYKDASIQQGELNKLKKMK
ncbi:nucleolar protein 14 homolog [Amyelois transitella]|uniref:nucleolar protein 14 homolog n=1 Tax=Amyelois transitella TaxID=680683 RepID=UPI0029907C6D|nr:nucleolar protein 14 homolog [Amyelois transitella]